MRNGRKRTFIIVRITLTEAKTALAGAISSASLAIFMASIAVVSEERTPSRRFGRWDVV